MITVNNVSLQFGKRYLFKDVNCVFRPGNCYGLIGANGSGKSTFVKILSGEIESTTGTIAINKGLRMSVLSQDQFRYDDFPVLETVIMGHKRLYDVMKEKDALYAKADFSDEDGVRTGELEEEFAELNGWEAESEASKLLAELGIDENLHQLEMKQLEASIKVRVLLAQALFGSPDILLLDEPTNQLDFETIMWLENFLADFENLAIVVSHDRHFLDNVCTHMADIDFGKIQLYTGNYSFWSEASQLALRQRQEQNKKAEDKKKELETFIARFSANVAKSRQATARKKMIEKLDISEIRPSTRQYPFINFEQEREAGNDMLDVQNISLTIDDQVIFEDFSLQVEKEEKVAFLGRNDLAKTALFQILMGEIKPDNGSYKWGISTSQAYFPKDNSKYFQSDYNLIDWLRQYTDNTDEEFVRGFLGRMLFRGEETMKKVNVLSGGEKVRCMLSRMMLQQANVLLLDEPTNHLDLESITALNQGLERYRGTLLFSSHDHQFVQTIATRIIEITPKGIIDQHMTLDEYLDNDRVKKLREEMYS